jgi:hypothetical protein
MQTNSTLTRIIPFFISVSFPSPKGVLKKNPAGAGVPRRCSTIVAYLTLAGREGYRRAEKNLPSAHQT